jgi:hypothetical protein
MASARLAATQECCPEFATLSFVRVYATLSPDTEGAPARIVGS